MNCFSVFDHFVGLARKGLKTQSNIYYGELQGGFNLVVNKSTRFWVTRDFVFQYFKTAHLQLCLINKSYYISVKTLKQKSSFPLKKILKGKSHKKRNSLLMGL